MDINIKHIYLLMAEPKVDFMQHGKNILVQGQFFDRYRKTWCIIYKHYLIKAKRLIQTADESRYLT